MSPAIFEQTPTWLETSLTIQNLLWARQANWIDDRELMAHIEQIQTNHSLKMMVICMCLSNENFKDRSMALEIACREAERVLLDRAYIAVG